MKTTTKTLLKELAKIAGAISTNSVIPILENFLFEIKKDTVTVTASDYEIFTKVTFSVESETELNICIPAKILLETLKALPEQPIEFIFDGEQITLIAKQGKYNFMGFDVNDYPTEQIVDSDNIIGFDNFQDILTKTLYCVSKDDLRPAMTGVYFGSDAICSTDAHRLTKYHYYHLNCNNIVPAKALNLIKHDIVNVTFSDTNAHFSYDNVSTSCRLIDAKYPDFNAVIPDDNDKELTINRKDFISSLKRINIYNNNLTSQVIVSVENDSLELTGVNLDYNNKAKEVLNCTYESEKIEFAFSGKFMIDLLSKLDGDTFTILLSKPNRAFTIKENDFTFLLMPIMIQ